MVEDEQAVAAAFAALGEPGGLEPFSYPDIGQLPYAGYDIIHRLIGIDMHDDDVSMARKLAANEWFWRRRAGQQVSYERVFLAGRLTDMQVVTDPTSPPASNGTG